MAEPFINEKEVCGYQPVKGFEGKMRRDNYGASPVSYTHLVVVEQNLQIIPQDQLENTLIQEGDQIEILCFVGGGDVYKRQFLYRVSSELWGHRRTAHPGNGKTGASLSLIHISGEQ